MSFWKYVIKTNWNQKKNDLREYRGLCQQIIDADNAARAARDRISVVNNRQQNNHSACITYIMSKKNGLEMDIAHCPEFFVDDNIKGCYRFACEYATANKLYHEACDKADGLREQRMVFWKQKFAHTK